MLLKNMETLISILDWNKKNGLYVSLTGVVIQEVKNFINKKSLLGKAG